MIAYLHVKRALHNHNIRMSKNLFTFVKLEPTVRMLQLLLLPILSSIILLNFDIYSTQNHMYISLLSQSWHM
jgi:hypothetical protein